MTALPDTAASDIPSPPRHATPHIRRRAWGDPIVRAWWLLSLVLLLSGLYLIGVQLLAWRHQTWLIRSGTPVTTVAVEVNEERFRAGEQGQGRPKPPNSPVVLEFDWKGSKREIRGYLEGRTAFISVGETVPIRINPADPDDWTARTENPPLLVELIGGAITLIVAIPMMLVSLFVRSKVLRTWRDGTMIDAAVVKTGQTPLAPLSRTVQIAADASGTVQTVYVPARAWNSAETVQILRTEQGRPIAVSSLI